MSTRPTLFDRDESRQPRSLECCLTSYATTRLSFDDVNALRKKSAELPGDLGFSMLRHTDEQTLAALSAVGDAIKNLKTRPDSFDRWGVVASSRYLGRSAFADTLTKYAKEGPWNVSVQVVPNRSLHSPASMVGLGLGCHGPCVGVGGGLDGETDAWLTAITLLDQRSLPGIWLVFCGWEPDEEVDIEGAALNGPNCTALALALVPASAGPGLASLRLTIEPLAPNALEVPAKQTAMSQFEKSLASKSTIDELTIQLGGGLSTHMVWSPAEATTIPMQEPYPIPERKAA